MEYAEQQRYLPLGRRLMEQRQKMEAAGLKVNQSQIARDIGSDSTRVNRFEKMPWRLADAHGNHVWLVLVGYGFHTSDIKGIIQEFNLSSPTWSIEHLAESTGAAIILTEGSVKDTMPGEPTSAPIDLLGGRPEHLVRTKVIAAGDLATPEVQRELTVGDRLYVALEEPPESGDFVIVEQDGAHALVIWPVNVPVMAVPYAPAGDTQAAELRPELVSVFRTVIDYSFGKRAARQKRLGRGP